MAWSPALLVNWEKGEPEAKMTVPSVQLTACSKVHSALVSGFDSGNRMGRRPSPPASTDALSARTVDSVKTPNVTASPTRADGLTYAGAAAGGRGGGPGGAGRAE